MNTDLSRRSTLLVPLIAATAALTTALPAVADGPVTPASVAADPAAPGGVRLPSPTGPYSVGTVPLHLVDRSRTDPWVTSPRPRELMVQVWYPAVPTHQGPLVRWMSELTAAHVGSTLGVPDAAAVRTTARLGAPAAPTRSGRPVVVYSHGFATNRALGTTLVEELASRGYVVVAIDHTHDAGAVEFPGGRLETAAVRLPADPATAQQVLTRAVDVRIADARFVLDQLTTLNRGGNPDVDHRTLPAGLCGSLRLTGVGALGHSLGGATAAGLAQADPRVTAGVNLDGLLFGPVTNRGLAKPFLQVGTPSHNRTTDPTWAGLAARSGGRFREIQLAGAQHFTFTDLQAVVPQVATAVGMSPDQVTALVGTLDPARSILVQRTYVTAFLDLHLRHLDHHLFDGPSPLFPEITFAPTRS